MPAQTVFAKYEPCFFGELSVKISDDDGWLPDFVVDSLGVTPKNESSDDYVEQCQRAEQGEDVPLDFESSCRDGLFEQDQLFAVLSNEDVQKLINRLQKTLAKIKEL